MEEEWLERNKRTVLRKDSLLKCEMFGSGPYSGDEGKCMSVRKVSLSIAGER